LVRCGCRVLVPFGVSNSIRLGIIIDIIEDYEEKLNFKKIYSVLDSVSFFNEEMMELLLWMKEKYFCTFFEAVKVIIPSNIDKKSNFKFKIDLHKYQLEKGNLCLEEISFLESISVANTLKKRLISHDFFSAAGEKECTSKFAFSKSGSCNNKSYKVSGSVIEGLLDKGIITIGNTKYIGEKICKYVRIGNSINKADSKITKKQKKIIEFLENVKYASIKEIRYFTGCTDVIIKNLAKNGFIEYFEKTVKNDSTENSEFNIKNEPIILTDSQEEICRELRKNFVKGSANLLHGVTGSGKTLILLKLIDYVLPQQKGIIYMVPEICLTTQVVGMFKSRYGENVAIMHSGLSYLQRFEEWKRIKMGKVKIVVGTRMAVFSPFENLGLIIIDEEQEHTYKSEFTPRFNAKDIAKFRSKYNKSMLILCSATPSIESYFLSQTGKYKLHALDKRYNNLNLPKVEITDMNLESKRGNTTHFSSRLIELIGSNLKRREQSIILINRRGYHTFAKCKKCGEVLTCPNCSISLNYHLANKKLMCHYCGYSANFIEMCPKCGDSRILYSGLGTQKVEETLNNIFPSARVLRVDSDILTSQKSYEDIFSEFSSGNYDIMIGTQMIAKGFNFSKVTLVGVLSADNMLWNNDFRSYEKTFSLITQVVGRSGRGVLPGIALIQSYTPENEVIKLAAVQNYKRFYRSELSVRKALLYPPFCDICMVGFVGKKEYNVKKYCEKFFEILCGVAESKRGKVPLRIFKPIPGSIKKIGDKYIYKIVIKCKENEEFRWVLKEVFENTKKSIKISNVNVFIDINPESIL
jgi:primosomal protein N' (replication factor Y)